MSEYSVHAASFFNFTYIYIGSYCAVNMFKFADNF